MKGTNYKGERWFPEGYEKAWAYQAFDAKACTVMFGDTRGRYDADSPEVTGFVYYLLHKLDCLDCLSPVINLRDRKKLHSEIINIFARNLAYYTLFPQQYNYRSRNILAPALIILVRRIGRYRAGHNLPFRTWYPLSKKEFGKLVTFIDDNPLINHLASKWAAGYHIRQEKGYYA